MTRMLGMVFFMALLAAAMPTVAANRGGAPSGASAPATALGDTVASLMAEHDAEIQAGALAVQKTQNKDVRDFADRLIRDHSDLNHKLASFAAAGSIYLLPKPADTSALDTLRGLSGAEFDREFLRWAVSSHQKTISKVKQMAPDMADKQLKSLLQSATPTLEEHLRMAEKLSARIGAGSK